MAYPSEVEQILNFMGYSSPDDFVLGIDDAAGGIIMQDWYHADPVPTPAEVIAQTIPWLRHVALSKALTTRNDSVGAISGSLSNFHRIVMLAVGNNDNSAKTQLKDMGDASQLVEDQYQADIVAIPTWDEPTLRAYIAGA